MMDVPLPKTTFMETAVVPEKLLMGPGPSNYSKQVRQALASPVLGHLHAETLALMDQVKKGAVTLFPAN